MNFTKSFISVIFFLVHITSFSQPVFWSENFSGGGTGWTLNLNGPGTNDTLSNEWVINSDYSACTQCGTSGGNLLHVTCSSLDATFCPLFGGPSCVYNAGGLDPIATDKFVSSPDISTVGYTGITLRFWYTSNGEGTFDYGQVRLSGDGGATWYNLPTQYSGTVSCTQVTINIPTQYENISNFHIGFRWVNNNNAAGTDPPFSIDDIELNGTTNCGISASTSSTSAGCSFYNGTATVNASGGTPPYTYQWSNGETTSTITGLGGGTYTVYVSDFTGCMITAVTTVAWSSFLDITTSSTPSDCYGNTGTATVTVTSGLPPYTYMWSNSATTATVTGLAMGYYSVTVVDANACMDASTVYVQGTTSPTLTTTSTPASCGSNNGTATVNASGAAPPYTYQWSNGQTDNTATGLTAGTYTVQVIPSGSGLVTFWSENFTSGGGGWTLDINGPDTNNILANNWVINSDYSACTQCGTSGGNLLHITCSSLDGTFCPLFGGPSCVYNMGGIDPIATDKYVASPDISTVGYSGIILKFSYSSGGESGSDYGLVRLSNDGGISWTDLPTQYSGTPSCTQEVVAIPANYENILNFRIGFRWINNDNSVGNDPPFSIDDIELVIDSGVACPAYASVTVGQSSSLFLSPGSTPTPCGQSSGTATVTVSGGTPPYTYVWSNGQTSSTATGLAAGTYQVIVSDAGSCSGTAIVTIANTGGPTTSIATSNPLCYGGANGIASVSATGGVTPYTFIWSTGQTTSIITGLSANIYYLTVTDASGCLVVDAVVINNPPAIAITFTVQDATCGINDGYAQATPSNGTSPYSYQWSNGLTTALNGNLGPGTYILTVTDANSCQSIDTSFIANANGPVATVNSLSHVTCAGGNDGEISVNATGGTPPYTYLWSNAATSATLSGLAAGTYTITVSDNGSCSGLLSVTITEPPSMSASVSVTDASCYGSQNGAVNLTVSGGAIPYTFAWVRYPDSAIVGLSEDLTNIGAGIYAVLITDGKGCTDTTWAVVGEPVAPLVVVSDSIANNTIYITASGGTSPYSFLWSNGVTTEDLTYSAADTYNVVVVDKNNCTGYLSVFISGSNEIFIGPGMKVFPNPSTGIFNIEMTGYKGYPVTAEVQNVMGQVIHMDTIYPGNYYMHSIDLSRDHAGIYILKLSIGAQQGFEKAVLLKY